MSIQIAPIIMDFVVDKDIFTNVLKDFYNAGKIENLEFEDTQSNRGYMFLITKFKFNNDTGFKWITKYDNKTNTIFIQKIDKILSACKTFEIDKFGYYDSVILNIIAELTKPTSAKCLFSVIDDNNDYGKLVEISNGHILDYKIDLSKNNTIKSSTIQDFLKNNPDIKQELIQKTNGAKDLKTQLNALGLKLIELKMQGSDLIDHDSFESLLTQCCVFGADNKRVLSIYKLIE